MKRRTDIQIINDIIKITLTMKNDEKRVPTKIQKLSGLSFNVLQKFLIKMIQKKLLYKNTLLPTKKGIIFHKNAEKILKMETELNKNL